MLCAHIAAVAVVTVMVTVGVAPVLALGAMIVLLVRALIGFRLNRVTAKQLGFSEIAFGALTVLAVTAGIAFRI